ncbi:MAG: nuclear transport factor 2 family protein [Acidobacteria bacterium]|nr:nuclear transport factor 2 family protein [Acidobacteriota bacterium]
MKRKYYFMSVALYLLVSLAIFSGCKTAPETGNIAADNTDQAKTANESVPKNENSSTPPETTPEGQTTAPASVSQTPSEAYKAAYAARKNKDIAALKKLMSKDMLEFFEIFGDGKPNAVDEGLRQLTEKPQGPTDETRNEKINGETATLEYLNEKGEWKTMDLIKENGSWKLTIAKMDQPDQR